MTDISLSLAMLSVGAGLTSVLSPCVLPVLPVIVAGSEDKDRLRPLLIVAGLSITFVAMGIVSSLFGSYMIGKTRYIEQAGGAIIFTMGIMVFFDVSIFKKLYKLSNINVNDKGRIGGLVLGMALGIIWIPCIGPMLSTILTMVGTMGQMEKGVFLLSLYSIGFSLPMLAVAYSSHILQQKLKKAVSNNQWVFRYITGGILILYGAYVIFIGNMALT